MALNDFRSVFLPYCIKRIKDKNYVVLNREYKPLGFKTFDKIVYEDYPIAIKFKRLTTEMIKKISYNRDSNKDEIFLYNDSSVPTLNKANMTNYLIRLELLAKLKVQE